MRKIDPKWNQVFNKTVYQMLKDGVAQCGAKVDVFETAFGDIMAVNGIPSTVKAMFDEQFGRFAASVDEILQDVKKTIKAEQKAANKLCEEIIQFEMTDVYQECKEERGIRCFVRVKSNMKSHLEDNSEEMFKEVHVKMESSLQKMLKDVKDVAIRELGKSCKLFNRTPCLDQGVQEEILEFLETAKEAFDAATNADAMEDAQREQSLPVRSAISATHPAAANAKPSQTYTAMDWGEQEEVKMENESEDESDHPSEHSDIQP